MSEAKPQNTRGRMNTKLGVVISDKMEKTVSIKITTMTKHSRYKKYVKRHSVLKVHDPKSEASMGDRVLVKEVPKVSKTKNWKLVRVLEKKNEGES